MEKWYKIAKKKISEIQSHHPQNLIQHHIKKGEGSKSFTQI